MKKIIYDNYEIDEYGNIYSKFYNKPLKPNTDKDGYLRITLAIDKKQKSFYVHRLVAQTFISNNKNNPVVNHKDGNKKNNYYKNLEWCTIAENNRHALRTGLRDMKNDGCSKIVEQYDMDMKLINTYLSANEAKRQTGFSQGHISECCRGEIKQYNGYVWRYKEINV